jgi:hypothetical protein
MKYRRIEYFSASVMLGWSVILAMPGDTLSTQDAFGSFLERGWTEVQLAVLFGLGGALWITALWINGHHRRTPVVRCLASLVGVALWSHIASLLIMHGLQSGVWSTGIAPYALLAFNNILSCYTSAVDAYNSHVRGAILDKLVEGNDS